MATIFSSINCLYKNKPLYYIKNIFTLFALGFGLTANAQERFSDAHDWNNSLEWMSSFIKEADGYLCTNLSKQISETTDSVVLVKYDFVGNIVNEKVIPLRNNHIIIKDATIHKLSDGYVVTTIARHDSEPQTNQTAYFTKLDNALDTVWTNKYYRTDGAELYIGAQGIIETSTQLIVIGNVQEATGSSIIMVVFDLDGTKTIEKQLTVTDAVFVSRNFAPTPDGGYLISGFADRDNPDKPSGFSREGYLLKVDADGNKEWDSVYKNPVLDGYTRYFWDMTATQDGNFLISSTYISKLKFDGTTDDIDGIVVKINPQGEVIWEKYLGIVGDTHYTTLKAISEASDGTILIAGESTIGGGGLKGMFFKLTPLGDVLWEQYYRHGARTGDHYINQTIATADGGSVSCGMSSGPQDGWLIKLDCNGCLDATCVDDGVACAVYNCVDDAPPEALFTVPAPPYQAPPSESYTLNITNESTYSGAHEWYIDNVYQGTFVSPSFDLLSGATYEIKLVAKNMTCSDEYVMNITVDAVLGVNEQSTINNRQLSVYPNPTSGVMEIVSDEVMKRVEVMDVTGKAILNYELQITNYKLDISQLAEGVYYLKVTYQNQKTAYQKIVKR
jgi:hypothetical protein